MAHCGAGALALALTPARTLTPIRTRTPTQTLTATQTLTLTLTLTLTQACYDLVLSGLRAGLRHIDTSENYQNHEEIGRAIADSGAGVRGRGRGRR